MTDAQRPEHTPEPWRAGHPRFQCTLLHDGREFNHGKGDCVYALQGWDDYGAPYDISQDKEYESNLDYEKNGMVVGQTGDEEGGVARMEDARRIVACVNACAGIPTEDLEDCVNAGRPLIRFMEDLAGLEALHEPQ